MRVGPQRKLSAKELMLLNCVGVVVVCPLPVPQIVYYVYAYAKLYQNGIIGKDELINITVPTGNFGNILAAFYAKQMGLPMRTDSPALPVLLPEPCR